MSITDNNQRVIKTFFEVNDYFRRVSENEVQKKLAPILRAITTAFLSKDQSFCQNLLSRLYVIAEYLHENPAAVEADIPDFDTFLVHDFINKKLHQILAEPNLELQKVALMQWWNSNEGYAHYIHEISQPAHSANDRARWGADPELTCLANLFVCNVMLSQNNRGARQLGDYPQAAICQVNIADAHWSYVGTINHPFEQPQNPARTSRMGGM